MSRYEEHYRFRDELVKRLQRDLLGPTGGDAEILSTDAPVTTYVSGILFPRRMDDERASEAAAERDDEPGDARPDPDETTSDTGVSLANVQMPSSMGITFAVAPDVAPAVTVTVAAAMYDPIDLAGNPVKAQRAERRTTHEQELRWQRRALQIAPEVVDVTTPGQFRRELAPGLELRLRIRPADRGAVAVTATLVNVYEIGAYDFQDAHCFFQPSIMVADPEGSAALVERRVPVGADEDEIAINRLLYRHAPTFAVGHGCAADWHWQPPLPRDERLLKSRPAAVSAVWTAFVPTSEVLLTDSNPDIDSSDLGMLHLAEASDSDVVAALRRLVKGYREWIAERAEEARLLQATEYGKAAEDQIDQCTVACDRMASGIELLKKRPEVMTAFRRANRAMALQRGHTAWIKSGREGDVRLDGRWRPFQIAFMLLCLDGIVDPDHPDRRDADLLWFPTGGGKTEAYLGLIAFTVFLRRKRKGADGGGVTALMRYTLRLLTLQQFERAATLICAMEMMRQEDPAELGDEPISLGMWVGRAATPNWLKDAAASLKRLRNGEELQEENPVQLRACPWCGTAMDVHNYEVDATISHMRIFCPSESCDFHHALPVQVVDEMIYRTRPTLIIATVDKFAQIAWKAEVASLFNRNEGSTTPPPELIIQDELHLISGPLGSLTGLYETAIDIAAEQPKIIASTATIRRARNQVRALFDREVRQFPPAGLDARDSWFAVETPAEDKASRRYVGLLTPNTSQASLLVRAYAALLHHANDIEAEISVQDAYWTLVGYFNSLRLLAAAELQVHDDVQDRLEHLAERQGVDPRPAELLAELTSRVKSSDIPQRLKDLERALPDEGTFDTVLATNMISVGVDVDRLGLMAIMGQPQTTAEYIQSSSRVGRQHPGLVVIMYNAARSRDRSHYENFTSYHSALYRQVESTSVTPFSSRARDRGLHAVLIGMARLLYPEARPNTAASQVKSFKHRLEELTDLTLTRVKAITNDERERRSTAEDLDYIVEKWLSLADQNPNLVYQAKPVFKRGESRTADEALLRHHSDEDLDDAFPTLTSLRDVDVESDLYLER
ncbi:helicase-related protein [Actinoallomurus sp. NPDC050550]|uniref:helicase-related protein n=1 Tax=Actinoallomurus sp. NPDC050550 TaxID=3154937 RepID=UPI0033D6E3F0